MGNLVRLKEHLHTQIHMNIIVFCANVNQYFGVVKTGLPAEEEHLEG
jgi:hypothetical protein